MFWKALYESNDKVIIHEKKEIKTPLGNVGKIEKDYLQRLMNFIFI